MNTLGVHRPRNVGWARAAALLYGDWGTSKAYVIGLAFIAAGYSALPIIIAVCALTALVGYNYIIICKQFPDGGGVYSAARSQSRVLAIIGALLLVANFTVTAAMSGWAAMTYFGIPRNWVLFATICTILLIGLINFFGPKHSGSLAITFAIPMGIAVVIIIALSIPFLTTEHLAVSQVGFRSKWVAFTGVILALSGVEAIANLTGVMRLDPDSSHEQPRVTKTAKRAIWPVAAEVVLGTSLLGWAMLSLPPSYSEALAERWEDMLRFLAETYATLIFGSVTGQTVGIIIGIIVGLLLLSAVNTAVAALIGLMYMMARDGEMPRPFTRLNSHGVPRWPLALAVLLPIATVSLASDLATLAGLYAIGVVGAIAVNLGSCSFNARLKLTWWERLLMGVSFVILLAVELTIARTKPDALFFVVCIISMGLGVRAYAQKRAGLTTLTVTEKVAAAVAPEAVPDVSLDLKPGRTILVAARGVTAVLNFAFEEARLRQSSLYVLYVKEVAVSMPGRYEGAEQGRWQEDKQAAAIMGTMIEWGRRASVPVVPFYAISDNPAGTILDAAATVGADILILGARHRRTLATLLKGDVVTEVARNLPENIQMLIYG